MTYETYQSFAMTFPTLRGFIADCWKSGKEEQLIAFVFALECTNRGKEIRA